MRYWLMKSEPDEVSIDDLERAPGHRVPWFGVRNYQARNFMRDEMRVGDLAFFYHSGCAIPGIAGICRVSSPAFPDETQFDRASPYFDAKSSRDAPRWVNVEVEFVARTPFVSLDDLRRCPALEGMQLLRRGNRLSITPVDAVHWRFIVEELMGVQS